MNQALRSCLILTFTLTCSPLLAGAPGGVAKLKWGLKFDEAHVIMQAKAARLDKSEEEGNFLKYTFLGGTFAGRDAVAWNLYFLGNKFTRLAVQFAPEGRREAQFRKIKETITQKYGTSNDRQIGSGSQTLSAQWLTVSALDQLAVEIKCWENRDHVWLQYSMSSTQKSRTIVFPNLKTNDDF